MSNEIPTDDQAVSAPRNPRQFVMDFAIITPRERSSKYFTGYDCMRMMTDAERRMAHTYVTANEYYVAAQHQVKE